MGHDSSIPHTHMHGRQGCQAHGLIMVGGTCVLGLELELGLGLGSCSWLTRVRVRVRVRVRFRPGTGEASVSKYGSSP